MKPIESYENLSFQLNRHQKLWLLIYKKGAEQSELALNNLQKAGEENDEIYTVDVSTVKDIHPVFGITTAPNLLYFKNKKLLNITKGVQTTEQYYNLLIGNNFSPQNKQQKNGKTVIVYTTPTCSWCNTLKGYLKSEQISFREIDVSRDEKMAQKMIQKSGQQGVPQTEINGQMVVGFNRERINQLLEI